MPSASTAPSSENQLLPVPVPETGDGAPKTLVQKGYDNMAQIYLDWQLNQPSPREEYLAQLVAQLSAAPPSRAHVLELGCGSGVPGTQLLAQSCGRVTGVDISQAQIELARERVTSANVEFVRGDMLSLRFPDASLDAVVGLYSIFHLTRDEQVVMMETIYGWLKPGGGFMGNFALGGEEVTSAWLGGEEMFWAGWDKGEWLKILEGVGFEIVKGDVVPQVEHGKEVDFLWVVAKKGAS